MSEHTLKFFGEELAQIKAEVARLVGLGATELWRGAQGPHEWVTLADPEGNEFCIT